MSILDDREKTHGDYTRVAALAQDLKTRIRLEDHRLSYEHLESLEMICVKIARIVCGDPHVMDHWIDISGYAELIHKRQSDFGELTQQDSHDESIDYPSGAAV